MSSNKEIPQFKSEIPEHLLDGASAKDRWIMENISKLGQSSEYVLSEQLKQNEKLSSIEEQVLYTNGKVRAHSEKLGVLDIIVEDLKEIVSVKRWSVKVLTSKWFYICSGFIIVGIITVVKNPTFSEWLKTFL